MAEKEVIGGAADVAAVGLGLEQAADLLADEVLVAPLEALVLVESAHKGHLVADAAGGLVEAAVPAHAGGGHGLQSVHAVFLGDSLTVGYHDYSIDVGGARILGYEGASPNSFVNRTVLKNADGADEIPLDLLAADPPRKLYLMVGTNTLVMTGNDEGFLNYYGRLLDELRAIMPDGMIFVQSVLPVRPEALEKAPGLSPERLASVNAALQALCKEKGCYYLDVAAAFRDESGALLAEYAQPDGIHLTVSGYTNWVSYLCTHVPYSKENPYQPGSDYYLDENLQALIADIP